MRVDEGSCVRLDSGGELPEVERLGRESRLGGVVLGGEGEAGGGVFAFQDEALAQDFVSSGV